MKWLRTLLQREKKEVYTPDDASFVVSTEDDTSSTASTPDNASSDASTNDQEYEYRDPLYREPPWTIPIPLPVEAVIEVIEHEFVPVLAPTYRVIISVPSEDDPTMKKEFWTVSRYTVRLKQDDFIGVKRSPIEDLVCIISLRFVKTEISAIDCEVPNLQNRRYYDFIGDYLRVVELTETFQLTRSRRLISANARQCRPKK